MARQVFPQIARWLVAVAMLTAGTAGADEAALKKIRDGLLAQSADRVQIFTAPWCAHCKAAKKYFDEERITYDEIHTEGGLDDMVRFNALGGGALPLILARGESMRGFSIARFEALYRPVAEAEEAVEPPVKNVRTAAARPGKHAAAK